QGVAPEGNVQQFNSGQLLKEFTRYATAGTAAAEGELSGVLISNPDEVVIDLPLKGRMAHYDQYASTQQGDGLKILHRVVIQRLVKVRIGRLAGIGGDQYPITIWLGPCDVGGSDHGAGTRLVVDHNRNTCNVGHALG